MKTNKSALELFLEQNPGETEKDFQALSMETMSYYMRLEDGTQTPSSDPDICFTELLEVLSYLHNYAKEGE